jgi:hypothetical protein
VTKPSKARVIDTLQQLRVKFGNVLISEAIAQLQTPRLGRRPWWCHSSRLNIFLCVEAVKKARGIRTTDAWREVAKFYGLSVNVVEKAYVEGRNSFTAEPAWLRNEAVIFHRKNAGRALKRFLQKSNRRQK